MVHAVLAIFFIGVQNGLRVGTSLKNVTGRRQLRCQVAIVVDLTLKMMAADPSSLNMGCFPRSSR
jgi:hypothetical protein